MVELNLQSDIQQALTEASPKERGKIVEKILKASIKQDGKYEFHDGTTATLDNGDISKIGHSKHEIKNRASVSMGDIVKAAVLFDSAQNIEHPKFSAFKYYKAKVKIGEDIYECVVNVGFGKFDKAYHIYDINQFEIVSENKNRSDSPIQTNPRKSVEQTVSRTTTSTDSISEKSEKVNTSDEKSSAKRGKKSKKRSKGSFTISEEVDTNNLTPTQKKAIKRLEILSSCLDNVNIVVVDEGVGNATGKYQGKNGWYDPNTDTIYVSITAGRGNVNDIGDYAIVETLSHEVVHFVKEHSESDYEKLKSFLQKNVYTAEQWNNLVLGRLEEYRKSNSDFTYEAAEEEVVANACQTMLNSPRVLAALAKGNYSLFERIKFRIADFFDNLVEKLGSNVFYTSEARLVLMSTQKMQKELEKKLVEAVRNAKSDTKSRAESTKNAELVNENNEETSGDVAVKKEIKYSIQSIPQSDINYVDIQVADIVGNNINDSDSWGRKARIYLREKFNGVVLPLGKTKGAYIRKEGINEYTNPAKAIDDEIYREKMLAATELDNLLKSGRYLGWSNDDGRHPDVIRWLNYETLFLVKDFAGNSQVLKGVIRIKRIARGDCFYDITKIENITDGNIGQSIINHAAESESDVSTNSIPDNSEKSNSFSKNSEEKSSKRERVETISREALANAFEGIAKTTKEKRIVQQYRDNLEKQNECIEDRRKLLQELTELRGQKGSEAASRRSELNIQIKNKTNQIVKYDEQLFNLQNSRPLKNAAKDYFDSEIEAAC